MMDNGREETNKEDVVLAIQSLQKIIQMQAEVNAEIVGQVGAENKK